MISTVLKIITRFVIFLLLAITLALSLIQVPAVQTYIVTNYVLPELKKAFGTDIAVKSVAITFFGNIALHEVSALDSHQNKLLEIKEVDGSPDLLQLIKGSPLRLNKITTREPRVYVKVYKGDTESNFIHFINQFKSKHPSNKVTIVELDAVLRDGFCEIYNYNFPSAQQHVLEAQDINLVANKVHIAGDDITAVIKKFSANAKNSHGYSLNIKELAAKFTHRIDCMELQDLTLKSARSSLNGNFKFFYKNEKTAFADFNNLVNWKVHFEPGSYFHTADLQYFVPTWNHHARVDLAGDVSGQLSRLVFENVNMKTLATQIKGKKIVLDQIYVGNKFNIKATNTFASTSYKDLVRFLPTNISPKIPKLIDNYGLISLLGDLDVSKKEIYAKATVIASALGKAQINARLTDYATPEIVYKGTVKTTGFNLKKLTNSNKVGTVSANLDFDGEGKNLETLQVKAKGTIQSLELMNKTLHSIQLDGVLVQRTFVGKVSSKATDLAFDFDGKVDFSKTTLGADFTMKMVSVNLYKLGVSKDKLARITAMIDVKLSGTNLDNILGQIVMRNTIFTNSVHTYAIQNLLINSTITDGKRLININSDELAKGYIEGDFKLSEITNVSRNAFGKLIPHFAMRTITPNQNFKFDFLINDYFFELFFPEISIEPGTRLTGEVTSENNLILKAETTGVKIGKYDIGNSQININTANPFFQSSLKSDKMVVQGYNLENVRLLTINNNDTVDIKSKFTGNFGGKGRQEFGLNLFQTVTKDGKDLIGFKKSTITYNNNEWVINPNNEKTGHYAIIDFSKKEYFINKILLESGTQKMELNGSYLKNLLELNLDVENTRIESVLPPMKGVDLEGLANGSVRLKYGNGVFEPIADFKVTNFELNKYLVGDINTNIQLKDDLYKVNASVDKNNLKALTITGDIDPKKKDDYLNLKLNAQDFQLGFLNVFLKGVLEKIRGDVSGEIELTGTLKKPEYQGSLTVANGGMKVSYLGTDYNILGKPELLVSTGLIHFYDKIELADKKFNTRATLTGNLQHENFVKWTLKNIIIRSKRILVLDTNYNQNPLYYGQIFAKDLFAEINGPATNLDIFILATTASNSKLTVNTGGTSLDASQAVKFVKLGDSESQKPFQMNDKGEIILPEVKGLNLRMNTIITPDAEFELVIDKKTDNKLNARGRGNVNLDINLAGKMVMNGEVEIQDGSYHFVFETFSLIRKNFFIRLGSKIIWSGLMFNPTLDIKTYSPITIPNISSYLGNNYSQSIDTQLEVNISKELQEPEIKYNMVAPDAPEFVKIGLQQKFQDPDELTKQFGYVLLFNQFLSNDGAAAQNASSPLIELAMSQLSAVVSNVSKYFKLKANYIQGNPAYNTSDAIKLSTVIGHLGPRLSVTGSAIIPMDRTSSAGSSSTRSNLAGEVQYDVSSENDGTLKVKLFSRPSTFGIENFTASNDASSQAWGIGIYYHEDFKSFVDFKNKLFKTKNKFKKEEQKRLEKEAEERQKRDSLDLINQVKFK